jgi:hypothetical protein
MKNIESSALGNNILETEVTHISSHGIWLLTHDKELFLPYEAFPWFKDQPVKSIINVTEASNNHFYWPNIDVDLTMESIEHPERFPLKATSPLT